MGRWDSRTREEGKGRITSAGLGCVQRSHCEKGDGRLKRSRPREVVARQTCLVVASLSDNRPKATNAISTTIINTITP